MTNASHEYVKNSVITATPEQLHLMLYDGAIRAAVRGLEALRANDREATFNALDRAQRIVLELANGLRREVNPPLADQMAVLYNFMYQRLVEANLQQDEQALHDALRILRHHRETWVLLMDKLRQEAADAQPQPTLPPTELPPQPRPISPLRSQTAGEETPAALNVEG